MLEQAHSVAKSDSNCSRSAAAIASPAARAFAFHSAARSSPAKPQARARSTPRCRSALTPRPALRLPGS
jgi:hypothetical protein